MARTQVNPYHRFYEFADKRRFKRLAARAVRLLNRPSVYSLAKRLQMQKRTLARLLNGEHERVAMDVLHAFVDGLGRELAARGRESDAAAICKGLSDAVIPSEEVAARSDWNSWAIAYGLSFCCDHAHRTKIERGERVQVDPPVVARILRRKDAASALREAGRHCPEILSAFYQHLLRCEVSEWRRLLAYLRLIEPLLHAADSGFVELDWRELSRAEWQDFLEQGIRREKLVLRHFPAEKRLRMISTALAKGKFTESHPNEHEPSEFDKRRCREATDELFFFSENLTDALEPLRRGAAARIRELKAREKPPPYARRALSEPATRKHR
jgi:transcriptional regulator with XRE-family HTH domain